MTDQVEVDGCQLDDDNLFYNVVDSATLSLDVNDPTWVEKVADAFLKVTKGWEEGCDAQIAEIKRAAGGGLRVMQIHITPPIFNRDDLIQNIGLQVLEEVGISE